MPRSGARPLALAAALWAMAAATLLPAGLRPPALSRGIQMLPGASGRVRKRSEPGTLILVRNGLPDWALPDEQFIGWADPDLSEEGQMQVRSAARLLVESGHTVDTVHTSMMKRSIRTVWIILHELERIYLPVTKDWRLAARRYGALTGLSAETIERHFGPDYLARLKNDHDLRPPAAIAGLTTTDYSATRERTFSHLRDAHDLHESETVGEALGRCEPAWKARARIARRPQHRGARPVWWQSRGRAAPLPRVFLAGRNGPPDARTPLPPFASPPRRASGLYAPVARAAPFAALRPPSAALCTPSAAQAIVKDLALGKNVLVVGHQLSLSSLIGKIEGLNNHDCQRMIQIPRGAVSERRGSHSRRFRGSCADAAVRASRAARRAHAAPRRLPAHLQV